VPVVAAVELGAVELVLLELAGVLEAALDDVEADDPHAPSPIAAAITAANERNLPHNMTPMMALRGLRGDLDRVRQRCEDPVTPSTMRLKLPAT
jgi:hypothetical protein